MMMVMMAMAMMMFRAFTPVIILKTIYSGNYDNCHDNDDDDDDTDDQDDDVPCCHPGHHIKNNTFW